MRALGKAPKLHKIEDTLSEVLEQNVHYSDTKVGVMILGVFQVRARERDGL